jgi:heme exporter protein B
VRFFQVAAAVARKDLRTELRSREMLPALGQFAILALLVANFAFDVDASNSARIAPGILWMVLVFAGLVAFGRTFSAERDQGSLEPLLLSPASRTAIFAGKAAAAALMLVACEAVLLPGLGLFFNTPIISLPLIATLLLATIGMAGLGCLFAALAAQTRARDLLLPVLAIPIWIPFVVAGGRAAQLAMGAGGGGSPNQALALLLDFDILFLVAASLTARFVLDD